jgi:hypothetical protein
MHRLGFEPMITVLEQAQTVRALGRVVTVIRCVSISS